MKRHILAITVLLVGALSVPALAEEIDAHFRQTRKFLKEEKITLTGSAAKAFQENSIVVSGQGSPLASAKSKARKKYTAITAAKVVAQRRLAEVLKGVSIVSEATVRSSMPASDVIRTAVDAFVLGAQVIFEEYNDAEEMAIVIIKMNMTGSDSFGARLYEQVLVDPAFRQELEKPAYTLPAAERLPAQPAEAYDGLIIDATAYNFRPALINRIFSTKGEVLYDPAKISQKVLVEQGCGEYTNSVDKAKAALGRRGVRNALVIKASGMASPSDLQVPDTVASQIFAANQGSGFMADARVAFVLK